MPGTKVLARAAALPSLSLGGSLPTGGGLPIVGGGGAPLGGVPLPQLPLGGLLGR